MFVERFVFIVLLCSLLDTAYQVLVMWPLVQCHRHVPKIADDFPPILQTLVALFALSVLQGTYVVTGYVLAEPLS